MKSAIRIPGLMILVLASGARESPGQALLLNEIHSANEEWIEIYNPSDVPEDLGAYLITKESIDGKSESAKLPEGTLVEPQGFLVLCADDPAEDDRCDAGWCHPGLCLPFDLDDDGGVISLYWAPECQEKLGKTVDAVRYPALSGLSYGRSADGPWCLLEGPTPRARNTAPCYPLPGPVVINEVSSAPPLDPGQCVLGCADWIELRWIGPDPVSLVNVTLWSRGISFHLPEVVLSAARPYFVVQCSSGMPTPDRAPFSLKKSGDSLILRESLRIWDTVAVPELQDGQYYARYPDGQDWAAVATPTPGASNSPPPGQGFSPRCVVFDRFPLRVLPDDPIQIYAQIEDPDGDLDPASLVLRWKELPDGPEETSRFHPGKRVTCRRDPEPDIFVALIPPRERVVDLSFQVMAADLTGKESATEALEVRVQSPGWTDSPENPTHLLRINEVAAQTPVLPTLMEDWVEIFNPSDQPIFLGGLYLTDDILRLDRVQIPLGAFLLPRQYYIVQFDGEDDPAPEEPHFTRKLDPCRDEVILVHSDGKTVIDYLSWHEEKRNWTLGKLEDSGSLVGIMKPTPRRANEPIPCVRTFDLPSTGGPVINEILADNWRFPDSSGESGDWIEIYNPGAAEVSMEGWTLRDNNSICDGAPPWPFPADAVIPPQGFLVVWCDNDECKTHQGSGEIHSTLEINRLGDYVELRDPAGGIVDAFATRLQLRDISVGRHPDGAGELSLLDPTPWRPNSRLPAGNAPELVDCQLLAEQFELKSLPTCRSPPGLVFVRGDATASCGVDISDAVFALNWLFTGGKSPDCEDAADANDSGSIDITDPIFILVHLFLGGPAPPLPYPEPGEDPTRDDLVSCRPVTCP